MNPPDQTDARLAAVRGAGLVVPPHPSAAGSTLSGALDAVTVLADPLQKLVWGVFVALGRSVRDLHYVVTDARRIRSAQDTDGVSR